jgi:DNA-binding NarL/FixJ family response regulator
MNGHETVKTIKTVIDPKVKVIMFTNLNDKMNIETAMKM